MRLEHIGVSCDVDIYTTKVAKKARESLGLGYI